MFLFGSSNKMFNATTESKQKTGIGIYLKEKFFIYQLYSCFCDAYRNTQTCPVRLAQPQ